MLWRISLEKGGNSIKNTDLYTELKKLVDYYARRLADDDGALWEFLFRLCDSGKAKNKHYAAVSLRHEFFRLKKIEAKQKARRAELTETNAPTLLDCDLALTMKELVETLPETQQQIVVLRFYFGFSVAEIATLRGVSRQAVNQCQNKALDKLRAML